MANKIVYNESASLVILCQGLVKLMPKDAPGDHRELTPEQEEDEGVQNFLDPAKARISLLTAAQAKEREASKKKAKVAALEPEPAPKPAPEPAASKPIDEPATPEKEASPEPETSTNVSSDDEKSDVAAKDDDAKDTVKPVTRKSKKGKGKSRRK